MKMITLLALLALLAGCAGKSQSTISYSGAFSLKVPTHTLSDATVFSVDGLSVAWPGSRLISGLVITRDLEALPPDFDLRDYPRYALGMKSVESLEEDIATVFDNSAKEFDYSFGLESVVERSIRDLKIYSACKKSKCMAFVIRDGVDDHILSIYTQKISEKEFTNLINGL